MARHRSAPRKAALFAVCLAGLAGIALWVVPGPPAHVPAPAESVALPDTLAFEVRYGGTGAEGVDMVWGAQAVGTAAGLVTIRMQYAGDPADRRMPVWPVNVWLFFSGDDLLGSFAAELSGTMNWRTGEMRVAGLVSDGARRDTALEQRMRIERPELNGSATVVFYPRMAWSSRSNHRCHPERITAVIPSESPLSSRAERGILPAGPETRRQDPSLRWG
jgi:hypothetical protein